MKVSKKSFKAIKEQRDDPSTGTPAKHTAPPPVATKDSDFAAKLAHLAYKASLIHPFWMATPEVRSAHELQMSNLGIEARELAKDANEYYDLVVGVSATYPGILKIKFSEVPVAAIKNGFLEKDADEFEHYSQLRIALSFLIQAEYGFYPRENALSEFVLNLTYSPQQYEHNVVPSLACALRDGSTFQSLRSRMYTGAALPNNYTDQLTAFKMLLLSPYCLQSRTVEVMHTMLLQAVTGSHIVAGNSEIVPDSILRRHFVDQEWTLAHSDIEKMWYNILLVGQHRHTYKQSTFTNLAFTEFLCTGQITAEMSSEITQLANYALHASAISAAVRNLASKCESPHFNRAQHIYF